MKTQLSFCVFISIFIFLLTFTVDGKPPVQNQTAMFRNSAVHSGVYETGGVAFFGGLQWRFQTEGPVRSSPVVAGNIIYVGSVDGFLYAIDSASGNLRWKFDAKTPVSSTTAVDNNAVYFGTSSGELIALRAATGKLLWSHQTGKDMPLDWGYETGDFFTSSPTLAAGKVLFGGGDGFLYAFDAKTGKLLWKTKTGGRIRSSPAVEGNTAFVGSFDGRLYAVEIANGKIKWRFDTEGYKLNSADFGYDRKSIQSSPAIANGLIYFGARDGFLYAVNSENGRLRWRFDHESSWVNTSPAIAGSMVYAASSDGKFLQCVDAQTGKEIWRFKTESPVWSSPAIVDQIIYFGDFDGNMFALDRTSGKEIWTYKSLKRILSSPVVKERKLYFGSDDGSIYAINSSAKASLKTAVFWDNDYVKGASFSGTKRIRDFLKASNYEVLNAADVATFMKSRINDRLASVVVFAIDHLPKTLAFDESGASIFRSYLENGGKIVWLGTPPLLWEANLETGSKRYPSINRPAAKKLLGMNFEKSSFDNNMTRTTVDGKRWGLSGWWMSDWGVDAAEVSTVLALDEKGLAAAWIKQFGTAKGTGFIKIPVVEAIDGSPANLQAIKLAAEIFPDKN